MTEGEIVYNLNLAQLDHNVYPITDTKLGYTVYVAKGEPESGCAYVIGTTKHVYDTLAEAYASAENMTNWLADNVEESCYAYPVPVTNLKKD